MLSTLPLFYIAQSVNSDDRRARFQGLRVIMYQSRKSSAEWGAETDLYIDVIVIELYVIKS